MPELTAVCIFQNFLAYLSKWCWKLWQSLLQLTQAIIVAPCLKVQGALIRASDRSQRKKSGFSRRNSQKIGRFRRIFTRMFGVDFAKKPKIKKIWPISKIFSGQILLNINRFCYNLTSIFNIFVTEIIICSFNNNTCTIEKWTNGKAFYVMTTVVPSFSQHTSILGSFRMLLACFCDEVLRLWQLNSPKSRDKFQICCTCLWCDF